MMQEEFESLVGRKVKEEDYHVIEFVYTWYPTLGNVDGKQQIATIYMAGGMAVINDMVPRSNKAKELNEAELKMKAELQKIKDKIEELSTVPEFSEMEV